MHRRTLLRSLAAGWMTTVVGVDTPRVFFAGVPAGAWAEQVAAGRAYTFLNGGIVAEQAAAIQAQALSAVDTLYWLPSEAGTLDLGEAMVSLAAALDHARIGRVIIGTGIPGDPDRAAYLELRVRVIGQALGARVAETRAALAALPVDPFTPATHRALAESMAGYRALVPFVMRP